MPKVIFVQIRQVKSQDGTVLENILPTEQIDLDGLRAFWSNRPGVREITVTDPARVSITVTSSGFATLPPAVKPNWLKNGLKPAEWVAAGILKIQA